MLKNIFLLVFITSFNLALAQEETGKQTTISGEIIGERLENDSIHFISDLIDEKYYETPLLSAKIEDNKFNVKADLSYPHLFRIVFASDKNKIVSRPGPFYMDSSTNSIVVNYSSEECSEVNGHTFEEYQDKFIPFFFAKKGEYDCESYQLAKLLHDKSSEFDSTLLNYVAENPDSYVALWKLIERFSFYGHSKLREKTLGGFSDKIKNEKLWPIINNDLKNAGVKEGGAFPVFTIQTQELKEQKLILPEAQYTLVDFWFSRCRPCLESFPALKKLYATYQPKGFEIVSVSTDRTDEVPLWQERIKEYELPWVQYLDENATESKKLGVYRFPSTFLLNQKGELIRKDISPEELEEFLRAHLN